MGSHRVVFEDTGPGMAPEVLARLFQSFHTSGKVGGTGLGLSFCKRTMLAFGGDITCESELGRFTRFTLEFPPVAAEDAAALNAAHPSWSDQPAAEGDRVLNGTCSNASKSVTQTASN